MQEILIQDIVDAVAVNAAIVDETGAILSVNKSWLEFGEKNGCNRKSIDTGANYFLPVEKASKDGDIFAQQVKEGIDNLLQNNISEFEIEYPCHSSNEQRWFIANIKEIGQLRPRKFLFTHKNITSLIERENRISAAQRLEAVGQLAGGIAHDFNNILSVLMGNLYIVQNRTSSDNSVTEFVQFSIDAVRRGASLVKNLLLLSKDHQFSREKIDANLYIRETLKLIGRTLGEDISIETRYVDEPLHVLVDSSALGSAILNIAINARHAMSNGGSLVITTSRVNVDGQIFLSADKPVYGAYVLISFTDSGCGISASDLKRVIEPFYTTKGTEKGSGLGLSMVYGFVQQSNGYLHIDSEIGKGTTISMYLPVYEGRDVQQIEKVLHSVQNIKGKKVLLVEDEDQVRKIFALLLENLGCQVIQVENGAAAEDVLRNQGADIDILMSDAVMPGGISGLDLAKKTSINFPHIKLLLTSGYPDKKYFQYKSNTNQVFSVPLLAKPFTVDELREALANLFSS